MMAMSKKAQDELPGEIEVLLPWHAAGTLSPRDARRVQKAIALNPDLARQYATVQDEHAETNLLNESVDVPSLRIMHKLFAAIDAEPVRQVETPLSLSGRVATVFGHLSPRTLATVAVLGALVLLLQAGVIGAVLMKFDGGSVQMAAPQEPARPGSAERLTRAVVPAAGSQIFVRFIPEVRMTDITAFLESHRAVIVDGDQTGLFRIQVGDQLASQDELANMIARLKQDRIVSRAASAQ